MAKDFFDEDLLAAGKSVDESGEDETTAGEGPRGQEYWRKDRPASAVSDLNLTRLAREKRQLDGHVAGAVHEIEQLERRQNELEQRRVRLEELARKQDAYERGKREIIEKLDRGIIRMEKDEVQAARMTDLLREMRTNFKQTLDEIKSIDEESWAAEQFEEELDRAAVHVDEAALLYKKGINRIEAAGWKKGDWTKRRVVAEEESPAVPAPPQGFGYWLKAGLAFGLPLSIVISVLFVAYVCLIRMGIL